MPSTKGVMSYCSTGYLVWVAAVLAAGGRAIDRAPDRVFETSFHVVRVISSTDGEAVPSRMAVEVSPKTGAASRRVQLSELTLRVTDVRAGAADRVVVIGETGVGHIHVIDSAKGLLDVVLAQAPSVSPGGRYVVFERFVQRGGLPAKAPYVVYDLLETPAANRFAKADGLETLRLVGLPLLYPVAEGENPYPDMEDLGGDPKHVRLTEFYWLGSNVVGFIDWSGGVPSLVVARLGERFGAPAIRSMDLHPGDVASRPEDLSEGSFGKIFAGSKLTGVTDPTGRIVVTVHLPNRPEVNTTVLERVVVF